MKSDAVFFIWEISLNGTEFYFFFFKLYKRHLNLNNTFCTGTREILLNVFIVCDMLNQRRHLLLSKIYK